MLKVDNLNVFYGSVQILNDLSFSVSRGQIAALLGGNGMGKTTTLKTLSGILHPRSGRIEFLGHRIEGISPSRVVKLGLSHVPQEREIFAQMSVLENMELGACVRNDAVEIRKDFERMYDYFPILKQRRNQPAGLLSGGEQQMLAIARGLMARPQLLLCDEPSAGLAPIMIGRIYKIIRKLNEDQITILLVEQNVQMAMKLSHYSYVLQNGRIVFSGSTGEIRDENIFRKFFD